jgi:solute carrier family 25 aspartate/glutamate transporter 12/13
MLDNLIAGSIAGAIGAFGVLPIDTTKTRVQSYKIKIPSFQVIKSIYILNGIRGFYKGGTTQVLFVAPEKAIKFTANDYVLTHVTDNKIFAGMCAGLSQVIVTNPMEILKIQMQMNSINPHYTIVDAIKKIGGIKNIYKGAGLCAMRDIPFSGIYFPLYSKLNHELYLDSYKSSLISGMIAAFACTPFDVIKTRIQYELNSTPIQVLNKLIINEGPTALFKGGLWRALKSGPQFMITQAVYNYLLRNK